MKSNLVLSFKDRDVPGGVFVRMTNLEAIDCKFETHLGHTNIFLTQILFVYKGWFSPCLVGIGLRHHCLSALQQNRNTESSWKWMVWQFLFLSFCIFLIHFTICRHLFYLLCTNIPRGKDTKKLFLARNLLRTELLLFYWKD